MDKKLTIVIILGCLLVVVNLGLAGLPSELVVRNGENFLEPGVLNKNTDSVISAPEEKDTISVQDDISIEITTSKTLINTPHANAGGPYSGKSKEDIQFDGSHSFVNFNKIVSYEWDFGDDHIGYGKNPTHYYSSPGVYYSTLTITDENGNAYQDIAPVYIEQIGNHLYPYGGCFYSGEKNEQILFDGSKSISNDPDAEINKWIWHLGDGTIKYGEKISHTYSEEKIYLVTLEVQDKNGCKRQDLLHADIGTSYSSMEDFFINSNVEMKNVIDILFNKIGSFILYPLLFVEIYTNYNGFEQSIPLSNGNVFPLSIDVNHDGDNDVVVNNLGFFKPVISNSRFNHIPWFAFETTISDIEIISNDITIDDDFTVCLQFSLQIIENFLDLKEPVVRIGYHSEIGEEKPNVFSATHIFRPYLLYKLFGSGKFVTENEIIVNNQVSNENKYVNNIENELSKIGLPLSSGIEKAKPACGKDKIIPSSEKDVEAIELEMEPKNNAGNGLSTITENGLRVESSDINRFSLLISFSNVKETTRTTLKLTFESFTGTTIMHRRGQTISDVDFKGSDNSSLTLSIIRENENGIATLGIFMDPVQSFGFSIDINKLANGGRQVKFNINNPPENLALFAKSQDTSRDEDSLYFYLRNLPKSMEFEWLPKLENGYISLTKQQASDELAVGVSDDLQNPYTNLYMTNLPTETSLNWDISKTTPKIIEFSSDTDGLTLNAELKNLTHENQMIDFHATSNEDFDIKMLWSIADGYFEVQRSTKDIDFDFTLLQENLDLNVNGNYQGGPDDGFKLNFNDINRGSLDLQSDKTLELNIDAENFEKETTLSTGLVFATSGNVNLEWNESINTKLSGSASFGISDFVLNSPIGNINFEEISFEENCLFDFRIDQDAELQLIGGGEVAISQFNGEIGYWSGSINSAIAGGDFDIHLKPNDKYYEFESSHSIGIGGFDIAFDGPGEENDIDFELDTFTMYSGGTTWFDFGSNTHAFELDGEYLTEVSNLHLAIGSGGSDVVNFTISDASLNKKGIVYCEWDDKYLSIDAAVDFSWDFAVSTLNFGDWETYGGIQGSVDITAEWDAGSGNITFDIGESGFSNELKIIHDELTLNLGSMDLEPGDMVFQWQREDAPTDGYFNILNNGISGDLSLCKITYENEQNPLEIELGTITLDSGNMYTSWSRQTQNKYLYIDNGINLDMDIFKISWNNKSIALEDLILSSGKFRFAWDTVDKEVTLNNGIEDLGPSISYEDDNQKISVSLTDLQDDYSKTMTLKWFEDNDANVSGLYLDTDGVNLIDWIEFTYIKYKSSGDTGRKIALGGLRADDFKISRNTNNILQVSGRLYIANHLTYSKLVDGDWKDLELEWDINFDGIGNIELTVDNEFDISVEILSSFSGADILTSFDLPDFLNISWDIDFDAEGYVSIDTDSEEIYSFEFRFSKNTQTYTPKWGIYLYGNGLIAEDYILSWDFAATPGQWNLTESGYLEPGSLDAMHMAWNGNWFNVLTCGTPI